MARSREKSACSLFRSVCDPNMWCASTVRTSISMYTKIHFTARTAHDCHARHLAVRSTPVQSTVSLQTRVWGIVTAHTDEHTFSHLSWYTPLIQVDTMQQMPVQLRLQHAAYCRKGLLYLLHAADSAHFSYYVTVSYSYQVMQQTPVVDQ